MKVHEISSASTKYRGLSWPLHGGWFRLFLRRLVPKVPWRMHLWQRAEMISNTA